MSNIIQMIQRLIKRARQTSIAKDSGDYMTAQVKFLGQPKDIKVNSPYGIYSSPPKTSEALVFSARNNSDDLHGIFNDYKGRIKGLKEGEVAVYNTLTGATIHEKADGSILILSKSKVDVEAPEINATADTISATATATATIVAPTINLTGNVTITGVCTVNGIVFDTHKHLGVTTGLGTSGTPTN